MRARFVIAGLSAALVSGYVAGASAQTVVSGDRGAGGRGGAFFIQNADRVMDLTSDEDVPTIVDAPFAAEATTEFTQILSDGNRIERRYTTSLARDSKGRTRREQDVALIGPLAVFGPGAVAGAARGRADVDSAGQPPRFVSIIDPVAGATYTLDVQAKTVQRGRFAGRGARGPSTTVVRVPEGGFTTNGSVEWSASIAVSASSSSGLGDEPKDQLFETAAFVAGRRAGDERTEKLGTAEIEGVTAEGTRTTMTIPAGSVGNQLPIEVVTERWFSPALQMAVRITRRDPRSGETVYRLTNLSRTEPPADLFVPPSDYTVHDVNRLRVQPFRVEPGPARK